jgi:hypothetical protein
MVGRHYESCRVEAFLKHNCFNFEQRFVTQKVAKNKRVSGDTEGVSLCFVFSLFA